MKSEKRSVKKQIKKRIEMGIRSDKYMITPKKHRPVAVDLVSRNGIRSPVSVGSRKAMSQPITYVLKDYGEYIKPDNVDYDALIYISSYNRYEKLLRILEQLYTQETKYTFKIILMDDGSSDDRYRDIISSERFKNLSYLKNQENGGGKYYWRTTNTIFKELKRYSSYCVIQIDDDFILCEKFIDILIDKFFELKKENNTYMGMKYHLGVLDFETIDDEKFFNTELRFQNVDGGTMFDTKFLELINYEILSVAEFLHYGGSGVWNYLDNEIRKLGVSIYSFRESLAYHDGNDESKMHPKVRKVRKYNTINFIDNDE